MIYIVVFFIVLFVSGALVWKFWPQNIPQDLDAEELSMDDVEEVLFTNNIKDAKKYRAWIWNE